MLKRWMAACLAFICLTPLMGFAEEGSLPAAPGATAAPVVKVTQVAQLQTAEAPEEATPAPLRDEDMTQAMIFTPNTGKASLREKAYKKAKLIKQCKGGTIVEVLEYGKQWTKIKDGKREGYIRTDCLKFLDAARQPIATADLSWRGTTTGGTRINIRNAPDMESHVIGQWRTGTDVMIFSHQDGWYEVEAFNMHGFVAEEYVTVKGE